LGEVTVLEPKKRQKEWPPAARGVGRKERPIPAEVYPGLDTDLARDNLENDLPAADLEDL